MRIKSDTVLKASIVSTLVLVFLAGCNKLPLSKKNTTTYTIYKAIYKPKSEALSSLNGDAARAMKDVGRIALLGNYIYLNETDKGIHIIDNANPAHPVQIAFLDIPGNQNVAVRGNILYADMYADLLALDISNPKNVILKTRLPNLFQMRTYVNGNFINDDQVVVAWETKDTTVSWDTPLYGGICPNCSMQDKALAAAAPGANSTSGSMAGMVLVNDYLYAIAEPHSIGIVSVANASAPELKNQFFAGFDLETMYPFNNKLFLGSASGMFMFDLTNPENPAQLGTFSHGRACDPVITDGKFAYVTLHAGTMCGGAANELNVVDVQNLMNPQLLSTYELTSPTGLSKDGDLLFVCDASSGVRIFDAATPNNLKQLKTIDVKDGYDVMASNGHAIIVAKDGLYQYDYSDLNNIKRLSVFNLK